VLSSCTFCVHKPSQLRGWARSFRSKNLFLRITRGRAVGSAAAENHEKKGRIDRRNRHVHYALLYGRALLSMRFSSWFPVDWGSLSSFSLDEYIQVDRTASRMQVEKERWKTGRDEKTKRDGEGRKGYVTREPVYIEMRKRERLEMVITKKGNELFPSTPRSNARRHVHTHARGMRSRVACACVRVTFHCSTPNGWLTAVKGMHVWLCA